MTRRSLLALALLVSAVVACKKEGSEGSGGAAGGGGGAATAKYPGTEEGAKQLLADIRTGDAAAMTRALRPSSADFKAVFVDGAAAKAEQGYEQLWSSPKAVIGADPANTELLLSKATTEELQKWGPEAEAAFPGGYKRVAAKYKPGLTVYRWKYVKPGEKLGMSFDGLIHVNGHWAWFPKPWRVLGGDGE